MFTARKVAQMAAYFADRQGGRINILKLMKLLYLADRGAMIAHGEPISFDYFVSMDHGPVLSRTLNLINGTYPDHMAADWDEWISDREGHVIASNRRFGRDDLDQLSDADLEVLDSTWRAFGHMNQWELVEYTHKNLPEWQNPNGSSIPILEETILTSAGIPADKAKLLAEAIATEHKLDRALADV